MKRALALLCALAFTTLLLGTGPEEAARGAYERYAVASDHALASEAGAALLAAGGNAADAAAATMLALGVTNPQSSGMGGGGFALYYRASDRSLTFLDFRERAPAAASPDMYADNQGAEGPFSTRSQLGGLAAGVPGEPAGVAALVRRFGSKPLSEIAAPAVRLASGGFAVRSTLADASGGFAAQMRRDATMRRWFEQGRDALYEGQRLRRPRLARTLRAFGAGGADAFYRGAIAREIVQATRRAGGVMTLGDLRDYRVVEREPLSAQRLGYRWVTAPPPSAGGYTMLASLALLERWVPEPRRAADGSALMHALAESWKGPFLDRAGYFGDPDYVDVPVEALLDEGRIARRAAAWSPSLAMPAGAYAVPLSAPPAGPPSAPDEHGTSHLCVVDAEGDVAAITTTVNLPFGARYTAAGVVMNDEMDDFASGVGEANAFGLPGGTRNLPGPGHRPVSTMSPTIVFDRGGPVLCIGASGGSRIVTAAEQVAWHILVGGVGPFEAVLHPRVHHQGSPNLLRQEERHPFDARTLAALSARGHVLQTARHSAVVQLVRILRRGSPRLIAVSDPRKGGLPAGR